MSFFPYAGDKSWVVRYFRKKASTAFSANSLVTRDSNAEDIIPAVSGSAAILGIVLRTVASTDADYASNTRIPVLVPVDAGAEIVGDVTGAFAVTNEGDEIDLSDAVTANAAASTTDILTVLKYISATKGVFALNKLLK